jgi:hypothetical protein
MDPVSAGLGQDAGRYFALRILASSPDGGYGEH